MKPYVSIIMPIYNASKFLKESLGGLVKQTLENIEIVCVNDGSTDDSLEIIKKYAMDDSRIKIINKANSGYGHSMNQGLKVASGEYIGILEPDDFTDKNTYEVLYNMAKNQNADVVKANYYEYSNQKDHYFEVLSGLKYGEITSAKENEKIIFMRPCIWSAIYRKDMLDDNNICFNETPGASYQDTAFAFKVWTCASRVLFVKEAFLHYRTDNENSSVKSAGKIFSICDEFQSMQAFLNQDIYKKNKYSKILQVLKLDSYTWNLNRIAPEYQKVFKMQIGLDFIKAEYDGVLDKEYFDSNRWEMVLEYINEAKNQSIRSNREKELEDTVMALKNSKSYKIGHIIVYLPGKLMRCIRGRSNGTKN